ncbi:urease accessory protein UreF [Alistipes sp.]|uniref:urease accessory protein UreF n=1 Tax=Alistipes sp. TaxID=1872444 RepID=UPI003AF0F523
MTRNAITLMRLLEFTDSAFPVGTFSFSNGLETAAEQGLVHDAATLEAYTQDIARQAAFTDGVAALNAWRSYRREDYPAVRETDRQLLRSKMNDEARLMTRRMGKKLAELSKHIFADETVARWLEEIDADLTPGCYPVAQGIVFAACGIGEEELFCSHQYGVVNMILSAALRCVRVSHFDTQRILFRAAGSVEALYREAREMTPQEMYTFTPQADILASLHEKGSKRLFMN